MNWSWLEESDDWRGEDREESVLVKIINGVLLAWKKPADFKEYAIANTKGRVAMELSL